MEQTDLNWADYLILIKKDVQFVQVGGLFNVVGGNINGVQVGGISNTVIDSMRGVQVGGVSNFVKK